jgi:long-subunit fatty acid transport protein
MLTESQGVFAGVSLFSFNGPRLGVGRSRTDLDVVTAGVAAGWRMNDRLSFGLGLVFSDVSLRMTSEEFVADIDLDELGEDEFPLALFDEIPFRPERRGALSTLAIDETDVTVNAGVLGKVSEQVSAGLFYRQGPKGRGTSEVVFGPATIVGDIVPVTFQSRVMLQIPDVAGSGLAWRSKDGRVTLAAEVDRVGYADLLMFGAVEEDDDVEEEDEEEEDEEEDEEEEENYQDTWEYHVGAEYAILQSTPIIAIRVGYWIEDDRKEFRNSEITHLTAGLGIAARSFQIDLAVDFSEEVDTTSLSCIYTF